MNASAKAYAMSIAIAGLTVLAAALWNWSSPDPRQYLLFLVLGLLGSGMKIRLPGLTGTMSLNFLVVLIGIAEFSFSETVATACAGALAQSLWRTSIRPRPIQIFFNMSALAITSSVAYWGSYAALRAVNTEDMVLLMVLAVMLLLVVNTGLVAVVLGLADGKPVLHVWRESYQMAFPYFAMGTLVAGLVCSTHHSLGWSGAALVLPAAFLGHLYYKLHLARWASRHAN